MEWKRERSPLLLPARCVPLSCFFVATSIIAKPKSYEDCILKNMKDAQTREASIAIAGACRKSFPNPFDQFDGQPPAGR